ncbi:hypothetical protein GLAREA_09734 [Glarea lozoyensis ATCC 20868]|uniref:Uncharacterized protein n=1 Tax=Glarea lozoyensis (strain ATCC 20868 / MF5171) TaxID=1116229 RepID=S3DQ46_GLAL2|nr:uncharacterized protein GLAREA_09734 [Glarea lozoyensis ATCC 20868]EPE28613.1 hypothetical protein GLAREA_09734 [Glarea lozoyensis ATCC 20868]
MLLSKTLSSKDLAARAANWTTQAWQTHCNNIDYFGDNDQCCIHLSGPNWKSCNGVGYATISDSQVLCYDLTDKHDCCKDDSVCDTGLGCCSGTCCQTSSSTTVCRDGCVAVNGTGCKAGTCAHGADQINTAEPDQTSVADSETATTSSGGSKVTGTPGATTSGPQASPSPSAEGPLTRADKIALGCGIGVGLPATLVAIYMCVVSCFKR